MPWAAQVAVSDATIYYDKLYTYTVPTEMEGHIFVGSLVLIPFGRGKARPRVGVVMELQQQPQPDARQKPLLHTAPAEAGLTAELLAIVRYLKEATFCTWFEAVRTVLPQGAQYRPVKTEDGWTLKKQLERSTETAYALAPEAPETEGLRLTEKQRRVLAFLAGGPRTKDEICASCEVTAAVPQGLAKKGLLLAESRDKQAEDVLAGLPGALDGAAEPAAPYVLTPEQTAVTKGLLARMAEEKPGPALLCGVTGSGKTPVFIELVRAALESGKTALVLVPEIGLTPQMITRLRAAFGSRVAVQHSAMSPTQRLLQWNAIRRGEAAVVVGTRSAVFAPLENLGLIIIDEEQEHTYQSESAPRYDAIELARRRAAHHGALLLLASATPLVAHYYAAEKGRMALFHLDGRYGGVPLPAVDMVDMRQEMLDGNPSALSRALATGIEESLAAGGQVILLLNRRGYHRVAVCKSCGKAVKCGECSVPMVYHRGQMNHSHRRLPEEQAPGGPPGHLLCHYCGRSMLPPQTCPECGGELRYAGFGTQRLEDELESRLPGVRVLRMDMDTTQRRGAHAEMLARFAAGEYDILLGTQMVAKGLDFDRVRLVGVVGIDALLFSQGYRAYENVFSLVTQVVGRSGRAGAQGRAIIQTVDPENPVLSLAAQQDYEAFYRQEVAFRKLALYPPFCALCVVGFAAQSEAEALAAAGRFAALLAARAANSPEIPLRVLGPAPMPVVQVAGSYRYRLTLKCRNDGAFRTLMRGVLEDYGSEGWPRKASAWLDFHRDA